MDTTATKLACPNCQEVGRLALVENVTGLAHLDDDGEPTGYTEIFWDTAETTAVECTACEWTAPVNSWEQVPAVINVAASDDAHAAEARRFLREHADTIDVVTDDGCDYRPEADRLRSVAAVGTDAEAIEAADRCGFTHSRASN